MKIAIKTFGLLIFLLAGQFAFGQTNKEKAYEKGMEAIKLTDDGNYTQAISLLKEAKKLDPENINYPYELAYTYYLSKDDNEILKFSSGPCGDSYFIIGPSGSMKDDQTLKEFKEQIIKELSEFGIKVDKLEFIEECWRDG